MVRYEDVYYEANFNYNGIYWDLFFAEEQHPTFGDDEYVTGVILSDFSLNLPCISALGGHYFANWQIEQQNDGVQLHLVNYGEVSECRIAPSPTAAEFDGSGTIDSTTGAVSSGNVTLAIPEDSILNSIGVSIEEIALPSALPSGFQQVESAINIDISSDDQSMLNAPLKVTVSYDDTGIDDETSILPLHFNGTDYDPVRIISQNTVANTITYESRTFSPFVLTIVDSLIPSTFDSGFNPSTDGWNINNFGSYFAPGGNCLGMSGYAVWHFNNQSASLDSRFTTEFSRLVTIRAHLAQSQTWAIQEWRAEQLLSPDVLGRAIKAYMSLLNEPLIFLMGVDGSPRHATVVYGYDETGFKVYDVNSMGQTQTIAFDGSVFGTYSGYNTFGYVSLSSLGRTEDFAALTQEALDGFTSNDNLIVSMPEEDEIIFDQSTSIEGQLLGDLNTSDAKLYLEVKGVGRQIALNADGTFSSQIEVGSGENTLVFLAGVDISNQSNWYLNGATLIRTIEGDIAQSRLLVTLTWDQNGTDVDLYITEPGGETMWYSNRLTTNGLELDFDNVTGFGPEHGTLEVEGDTVEDGFYVVRVHYYSDHDTDLAATGNVTIVVNEGSENQVFENFNFSIPNSNPFAHGPGGCCSGPTWVDIAVVDVVNGIISQP
jgi:uncharacterized protein YfaP (DUF2135 family)